MIIRQLQARDITKIEEIHGKYYKDEFQFAEFFTRLLDAYVVEDDDKNIITVAGIRPIAEVIMITNKDISVKIRKNGLIEMLNMLLIANNKLGFDQLHAFIQDESWEKILFKYGFHTCAGKALVI